MKRAAAYIRVSTDDQTEYSPDSQLKAISAYADKNGFILNNDFIFSDEGISGRGVKNRPGFNKMIAAAKAKRFDVILVWKFSRFARNREDSIVYKSMLRKEYGIEVISVSEDIGDDKMSVLFEAMIEAMDEYYSLNLAEEVKRGMAEKAKRGGILSAPPFGYAVKNGKFEEIESESYVIKKVFNDYRNGKSLLAIAKELNIMGVRTHRGNMIENRTIKYWLRNPVYIGMIHWSSSGKSETPIITRGAHRAIIDIDLWNDVQNRLSFQKQLYRRYYTSPRTGLSHWLTGIVRCSECGAVLANQHGYFVCSKKGKGLCEGCGYISASVLEKIILTVIDNIMIGDAVPVLFDKRPHGKEDEPYYALKNAIKKLESRLNRAKAAYEEGIYTLDEYKKSRDDVIKRIDSIKKEMNEEKIENDDQDDKKCEEPKRLIDILRDEFIENGKKNMAVRAIIKEIIKDKCTIKCVFYS